MSIRRRALNALVNVTEEGAYANLALKEAANGLSETDARFLFASVYGVLDHLVYLDYVLAAATRPHKNRFVRGILRMGANELLFMRTPAHAAVSESVSLCREIGKSALASYINGVLRTVDRMRDALPALPTDPAKRLSVKYSYPEWLVSDWMRDYGEEFTETLLAAKPAGLTVRAQYPCTTEALISELPCTAACGTLDPNALHPEKGFAPAAFPAFAEGRMTVQGEGAMLVCRALGDLRNKRVLDACAAPGGKSAYLASLTENQIALTCLELHPHRAELMEKTFARLNVTADIRVADASKPDPAFLSAFDAVLADVPCSGLGLLSEKPDLRYAKTGNDIEALVKVQGNLLNALADCVRPGGILVYATCTISKRENGEQVGAFLASHPKFILEPMPLGIENDGMLQLFPNVHKTDGFFMARMKRCS